MRLIVLLLFILPVLQTCQLSPEPARPVSDVRSMTVLYSNDEHGWMEGREVGRGAANLMGLWREKEGYTDDGPFLILSGGDHWTGPAISTWFEGEGMVEVMNAMGYDATAVGNHEFDFGLDNLTQRLRQANFPYLAANVEWTATKTLPSDLGFLAATIKEVNGLRIGIIGLSTTDTPNSTNPINVAELSFLDYEPSLRRTVAQLESQSPDLVFVVAHVCMSELRPLAAAVVDLNISLMGGGHCNELVAERVGRTILVESGGHFASYARAQFDYDIASDRLLASSFSAEQNLDGAVDVDVQAVVARWRTASAVELNTVLGFSAREYAATDDRLQRAVAESWMRVDSSADFAINNRYALRAPLPEGELTLADIVGLLPFENSIYGVDLSGAEILVVIGEGQQPFVTGLIHAGDEWLLSETGQPIDVESTYRVLINSFMYEGGAGYDAIADFDARGFDTEIHYRQPFIDWLTEQQSSAIRPIELP